MKIISLRREGNLLSCEWELWKLDDEEDAKYIASEGFATLQLLDSTNNKKLRFIKFIAAVANPQPPHSHPETCWKPHAALGTFSSLWKGWAERATATFDSVCYRFSFELDVKISVWRISKKKRKINKSRQKIQSSRSLFGTRTPRVNQPTFNFR